ncbi:MAG: hypothetical protein DRI69_12195 [Bacteroidetes bacterium]|nr:MAG: hypothetical protein DRI69_12195 [Bacteroidota bacterium]
MTDTQKEPGAEMKAQVPNPLVQKKEALTQQLQQENERIMQLRQQKETIESMISAANDKGQRIIGALNLIEELLAQE